MSNVLPCHAYVNLIKKQKEKEDGREKERFTSFVMTRTERTLPVNGCGMMRCCARSPYRLSRIAVVTPGSGSWSPCPRAGSAGPAPPWWSAQICVRNSMLACVCACVCEWLCAWCGSVRGFLPIQGVTKRKNLSLSPPLSLRHHL